MTDSIEELLDLGSLIQISADFQVMQVQLETLNESLEERTIPKAYRGLANVFSLSNANTLPPHQDEDHAIELEPGKTLPFDPLYNLSEYQLKTLQEYIDENLANGLFDLLNSLPEHLSCLPLNLMVFYVSVSITRD